MRRTLLLGTVGLLAAPVTGMGSARAQGGPEEEAVKAANAAYYAAISARDIGAVERLWARQGPSFNIFGAG